MKQELIKLAKDKGFISTFLHNEPFKYSSKEDLRGLFWMTELQKWLREKEIHVEIQLDSNSDLIIYNPYKFIVDLYVSTNLVVIRDQFDTYEQALEAGLMEGLKQL